MAVVYNNRLVYGVWGDTNTDGSKPLVGEASLATANLCFGKKYNANSGYNEQDILHIAFSGRDAIPQNAAWDASNAGEFENSISGLGKKLVDSLIEGSNFTLNSTDSLIRGSGRIRF